MNQEIQITKLPSQRQQQPELPREDGTTAQDHRSQDPQQPEHGPHAAVQQGGDVAAHHHRSKLTVLPLVFLIYFEVAGGPYGSERAVRAAGPLFTLLGFLVFPFAWGVPESLVTAELAAALPGNGGFVLWADRAFGPLAGSLLGTWKYLSCVINIAAYPALVADYLGRAIPAVAEPGRTRTGTVVGMTVFLSFLNYTGLSIVGWGAVALGLASLAPFLLMTGISVPKLRPRRWAAQVAGKKDWRLFFNTLFWNLNYWDSASTMAGEVDRPERTFPRALAVAVVLIAGSYLLPLMAAIGATDARPEEWQNGYLVDAAGIIGGGWLKYWIQAGAVLSSAEQRRVPAAGHVGAGPPPGRVRPSRHPVPHPVRGHRRLHRHHHRRLLPGLRRRGGHRQLPVQPGHAAGVRGVPVAPRQAARPEAALPRAAPTAGAGGHVRRAVGVPGVRVRGGRVEGVRARWGAHGAWRRSARRHGAVQVQEVAQVQHRRSCGR